MPTVPAIRILKANNEPPRGDRAFVLYWMTASRRTGWNYALERAVEWAVKMGKPLVVFEPLRVAYPWASERFHRFIIDGMADNARKLAKHKVLYYPYVEPFPDEDKGLLTALSHQACVIISDDFPAFFLPRMVASAAGKVPGAHGKSRFQWPVPHTCGRSCVPYSIFFQTTPSENPGQPSPRTAQSRPFQGGDPRGSSTPPIGDHEKGGPLYPLPCLTATLDLWRASPSITRWVPWKSGEDLKKLGRSFHFFWRESSPLILKIGITLTTMGRAASLPISTSGIFPPTRFSMISPKKKTGSWIAFQSGRPGSQKDGGE